MNEEVFVDPITMQQSFLLPFEGMLDKNNRWVVLSGIIPWKKIDDEYKSRFNSHFGPRHISSRIALGTLIIKASLNVSDREVVRQIFENPYLQYFLGYSEMLGNMPFDSSTIVYFRKKFDDTFVNQINDEFVSNHTDGKKAKDADASSNDNNNEGSSGDSKDTDIQNKGSMSIDASCTPADITYPTDLKILNESRKKTEKMISVLHKARTDKSKKKPRTYKNKAKKSCSRIMKKKRSSRKEKRDEAKRQISYIERNLRNVEKMRKEDKLNFSIFGKVLYKLLLVIFEVVRQQKEMLELDKNSIENRIVNIYQPHIRPIVRGKAGKSVEFGAKISSSKYDNGFAFVDKIDYDAYNECKDIPMQIDLFKQRTGYYPETIYADQIYITRENRKYCDELGIRLAGKKLGRPSKDTRKTKQAKKQANEDFSKRQEIEGVFGVGKRRYSLDLIMTKLANTSKTEISVVFLVMNLMKVLFALFYYTVYSIVIQEISYFCKSTKPQRTVYSLMT